MLTGLHVHSDAAQFVVKTVPGLLLSLPKLQSQFSSGPKTKVLVETLAKVGADPEEYTLLILNEQVRCREVQCECMSCEKPT